MKMKIEVEMERVLECIPVKPCGVTHKEIAEYTGFSPVRVRKLIRLMRKNGTPICSNNVDGYWMARNRREILEQIKYLETYIHSMEETCYKLRKAYCDFKNN